MKTSFNKVIIFGTGFGIAQSLPFFPKESILGIVGPSNRPEQLKIIQQLAEEKDLNFIVQPTQKSENFKSFCEGLQSLKPDLIWSNSYSMIIPKQILSIVNYNAINIHWSLLPLNQGPNPIQWSIIKNEKATGVTFHFMDDNFDTGDIIFQESVPIEDADTWVSVFKKLEDLSFHMHEKYILPIMNGKFERSKQDQEKMTVNTRLTADFPEIKFDVMSDIEIYNLIRAQVAPLKGAYLVNKKGERIYFNERLSIPEIATLRSEFTI